MAKRKLNWWFDFDPEGLSELQGSRPVSFIAMEGFQNMMDAGATRGVITIEMLPGSRTKARLIMEDNAPGGFEDISDSWTVFGRSRRRKDPTKRGRYMLGEKLILSMCDDARIISQNGAVAFLANGKRNEKIPDRTETGTRFEATIRLTKTQIEEIAQDVQLLLPPAGFTAVFNDIEIPHRVPDRIATDVFLDTEFDDEEGRWHKSRRKTEVHIVGLKEGEVACLYEMGIPVVETDMPFHVDVQQKVLLNMNRDNVTPKYLREVSAAVLNATHDIIPESEVSKPWVHDALTDDNVSRDAVLEVKNKMFGEKAVSRSLDDAEANSKAQLNGYEIIPSNAFSKKAWQKLRDFEIVQSSAKVFPTYKPYSEDPSAPPVDVVKESDYSTGMKQVVALTRKLARLILDTDLQVRIVRHPDQGLKAAYVKAEGGLAALLNLGPSKGIDFNLKGIGRPRFDRWREELAYFLGLIGHEFAHDKADNHFSEDYHGAMQDVLGRIAVLALEQPALFEDPAGLKGGEVSECYVAA